MVGDGWLIGFLRGVVKIGHHIFPKIGVPQNGWFIMENPIKIHDLVGPPLFLETPISFIQKKIVGLCDVSLFYSELYLSILKFSSE